MTHRIETGFSMASSMMLRAFRAMVWPSFSLTCFLFSSSIGLADYAEQVGPLLLAAQSKPGTPSTAADLFPLFKAADAGDARLVKSLLDSGAAIEATDPDGWTPLMFASAKGHAEVVNTLLKAGAKTDAKARDGSTALIIASLHGRPTVVKALVEAGADVNAPNQDGLTPLLAALFGKQSAVAKALVGSGARVNVKTDDGTSALMVAILSGQQDTAKLLLGTGVQAHGFYSFATNEWRRFADISENSIVLNDKYGIIPLYFKHNSPDPRRSGDCAYVRLSINRNTLDAIYSVYGERFNIGGMTTEDVIRKGEWIGSDGLNWVCTSAIPRGQMEVRGKCTLLKYQAPPERIGF